jgi:hypothetical protein
MVNPWEDRYLVQVYTKMAKTEPRYRPGAPTEAFSRGSYTSLTPEQEADPVILADEAEAYVARHAAEEEEQIFDIGCASGSDRPALMLLVEAARALCAVQRRPLTRKLIAMALAEMDKEDARR